MSNLLKFNTVYCKEDKKVIDYNELIQEKLADLADKMEHEFGEEDVQSVGDEFMAGLTAQKVEVLLEEEVEEAMEEISAEELIENAQTEADTILEKAKKTAENLQQQSYQEGRKKGYDDGYAQAVADVESLKLEIEKHKQELDEDYQRQLDEMEPMLVNTIADVVQRVFKIKFEDNKNLIVYIVKNAVAQIENSKEFLIKVSKEDYPYILKYKEIIEKSAVQATDIVILEDITLSKNQCLIETDGGVFDCGLDTQLDNLIKTLKILSLN